ncbi:MAG TPA: hypothetical protein VF502_13880 [Stellaceae bacterium]
MLDIAGDLDSLFGPILPLDRGRMITEVERARRRAGATAEGLQLSKKQTNEAWDEVERFGRLLFFLKFAKRPPNATGGEIKLYDHVAAALQAKQWLPIRSARARRPQLTLAG